MVGITSPFDCKTITTYHMFTHGSHNTSTTVITITLCAAISHPKITISEISHASIYCHLRGRTPLLEILVNNDTFLFSQNHEFKRREIYGVGHTFAIIYADTLCLPFRLVTSTSYLCVVMSMY